MNTSHSKRGFTGLDDNTFESVSTDYTAIGHWDIFVNCATLGRVFSNRRPLEGRGKKGTDEKGNKKRRKDTRLLHDKDEEATFFVEIFHILLTSSEVAGRVFCITLYANEIYALPEPRNKLHVYR